MSEGTAASEVREPGMAAGTAGAAGVTPAAPKVMCMICESREATVIKGLGTSAKGKALKIRF